jgi:hypothetical protein
MSVIWLTAFALTNPLSAGAKSFGDLRGRFLERVLTNLLSKRDMSCSDVTNTHPICTVLNCLDTSKQVHNQEPACEWGCEGLDAFAGRWVQVPGEAAVPPLSCPTETARPETNSLACTGTLRPHMRAGFGARSAKGTM